MRELFPEFMDLGVYFTSFNLKRDTAEQEKLQSMKAFSQKNISQGS